MSQVELVIYNTPILPSQRATIMLPMPELYDWTPMTMPVHIFRGEKLGPILCLTSAIHGDEVNGIEIIRRLLKSQFYGKFQEH